MSEVEVVVPDEAQWGEILTLDARNFGLPADSFVDPIHREVHALERFRVARFEGRVVGAATSVPLELTLPGGATTSGSGLTWVSVGASHRRRGVLRRLVEAVHADGRSRGEPVQMLFASEAGIYGRFGYGEVTEWWGIELDAASARLHPQGIASFDLLRVDDADDLAAGGRVAELFDAMRRGRPGEVNRTEARWRLMRSRWGKSVGEAIPVHVVTCDGGYAAYRVTPRWDVPERGDRPGHILTLVDFVALTPAASRSLWHRLVHTDLVATIRSSVVAGDDPLPLWLADRRWLRTVSLHDGLWVRVDDPAKAFATRRYGVDDRLTLSVEGVSYTVEGGPGGAICTRGSARADLVIDPQALGPLLLGPRSLDRLIMAGRVTPVGPDAGARAVRFFAAERPAHCSTLF